MSSITTQQTSSSDIYQPPKHGKLGPFASQSQKYNLPSDPFGLVLSFLRPEIQARFESVCTNWRLFISDHWARLCQKKLLISSEIDPKKYLPMPSYNGSFQLISSRMLGEDVYRKYLGGVDPVPPIPEAISLKRWNEPDPCDPTKKIGDAYIWMYCPSHIEVHLDGFDLDKPDDPNEPEAPRLIQKEGENKTLKVPVTIYNLIKLFEHVKTGLSEFCCIWSAILEQHGDKRIESQWRCERKDVIEKGLSWPEQIKLADKKGVIITQLIFRLLYNLLEHARFEKANWYPDGVFVARTLPLTDVLNTQLPANIGVIGYSLDIDSNDFVDDSFGVAVALGYCKAELI